MQLHLFSTPGEPSLRDIVDACRPSLERRDNPTVAYLPEASVGERYVGLTKVAFKGLAKVDHVDVEKDKRDTIEAALDKAALLYIPGGNTYLLSHRLHKAGLMGPIRRRVLDGLPLVAFSAGAVLCGPNILTTNDMNCCASTSFSGLALTPFNFNVHYPQVEGEQRELRDERLWEYHTFHHNSILALEDGAYIRVSDGIIKLMKGNCWLFEHGKQKAKVEVGVKLE